MRRRKNRRNFLATLIIIAILLYVALSWALPNLINILGTASKIFKQTSKTESISDRSSLAPPVLFIPYEATNSAKIDIKGYAQSGLKIKIFLDNELKGETDVLEDGSFIVKNIELNLGTQDLFGKTIDDKGQESLISKIVKITYDNEKPTLEITEPEDNKEIKDNRKVKISGKTEVGTQVFVNSSQVIIDSEGKFQTELSLSDGENIFTIKAEDKATNYTEIIRRVLFKPS